MTWVLSPNVFSSVRIPSLSPTLLALLHAFIFSLIYLPRGWLKALLHSYLLYFYSRIILVPLHCSTISVRSRFPGINPLDNSLLFLLFASAHSSPLAVFFLDLWGAIQRCHLMTRSDLSVLRVRYPVDLEPSIPLSVLKNDDRLLQDFFDVPILYSWRDGFDFSSMLLWEYTIWGGHLSLCPSHKPPPQHPPPHDDSEQQHIQCCHCANIRIFFPLPPIPHPSSSEAAQPISLSAGPAFPQHRHSTSPSFLLEGIALLPPLSAPWSLVESSFPAPPPSSSGATGVREESPSSSQIDIPLTASLFERIRTGIPLICPQGSAAYSLSSTGAVLLAILSPRPLLPISTKQNLPEHSSTAWFSHIASIQQPPPQHHDLPNISINSSSSFVFVLLPPSLFESRPPREQRFSFPIRRLESGYSFLNILQTHDLNPGPSSNPSINSTSITPTLSNPPFSDAQSFWMGIAEQQQQQQKSPVIPPSPPAPHPQPPPSRTSRTALSVLESTSSHRGSSSASSKKLRIGSSSSSSSSHSSSARNNHHPLQFSNPPIRQQQTLPPGMGIQVTPSQLINLVQSIRLRVEANGFENLVPPGMLPPELPMPTAGVGIVNHNNSNNNNHHNHNQQHTATVETILIAANGKENPQSELSALMRHHVLDTLGSLLDGPEPRLIPPTSNHNNSNHSSSSSSTSSSSSIKAAVVDHSLRNEVALKEAVELELLKFLPSQHLRFLQCSQLALQLSITLLNSVLGSLDSAPIPPAQLQSSVKGATQLAVHTLLQPSERMAARQEMELQDIEDLVGR